MKNVILSSAFCLSCALSAAASADSLYVGFGGSENVIGIYPLVPQANGTLFDFSADPLDLTIAGNKMYWISGDDIMQANLDGSGLTDFNSFGVAPTSVEVDATGGNLYVGFGGSENVIGLYPLVPQANGTLFDFSADPLDLTIAGNKMYWISGDDIMQANLDGSGLTDFNSFGATPTSIEVYLTPAAAAQTPEPAAFIIFSVGGAALFRLRRREREPANVL